MNRYPLWSALGLLAGLTLQAAVLAAPSAPLIGDTEQTVTLPPENTETRGLAIDEFSAGKPRLLVLDRNGKVFAYMVPDRTERVSDPLKPDHVYDLPAIVGGRRPALVEPRGLACAKEAGHMVLYTLGWDAGGERPTPSLWRFDLDANRADNVNLAMYQYRIGTREPLDVTLDAGQIVVSFDAAGYTDGNLRVQRGLLRLEWKDPQASPPKFIRHMPDAGTELARGLTIMDMDGVRYLWATIGNEYIYCADAPTGRGLFWFDRPFTATGSTCRGLAFGAGDLWVSENAAGPDRVHRVNVTRNLDALREGPRALRHLVMSIDTRPEKNGEQAGKVYHNYSRPYAYEQLHNQGYWPETEKVTDTSNAPNATVKHITLDPAGDAAARQNILTVEYAEAPARRYSSRYELDMWTNTCRSYVYPHRANRDGKALAGTDYLADDPYLYNLSDKRTYQEFIARVAAHIQMRYGVPADMDNPYWAARNIVEYIQDNYYYPIPPLGRLATTDYDRKHYDANPGNLKLELSDRPYDKTQIIACSGTSVAVSGAMRHLGIPARWLGTGTEQAPRTWDTNGNGLLDAEETAGCTNGHRYDQIWLGNHYGWVCFDATPSRPPSADYDPPPPLQSQWRLMNRCAAGHMADRRIVFNVGSGLLRQMYFDFEYDAEGATDNKCGGDQRYNLMGRFDQPERWRMPGGSIAVRNLCFLRDVKTTGPRNRTRVSWQLEGQWDKDPAATLCIKAQVLAPRSGAPRPAVTLARGIRPGDQAATVDLSAYRNQRCRLLVLKEGDEETGGISPVMAPGRNPS